MKELGTGRSRGFGFVSYEAQGDAAMAIRKMQGYKILGKRLKVEFKKGEGEEEEKPDTKSSVDDERLIGYLRAISAQNVVQSLKQDLEVDPPSEEPTEPTSWRLCAENVLAFGRFVYVSFTIQVVRACRTSKKRLPEEEVPWNDGKNMLVSEHPILSCQYQGTKKNNTSNRSIITLHHQASLAFEMPSLLSLFVLQVRHLQLEVKAPETWRIFPHEFEALHTFCTNDWYLISHLWANSFSSLLELSFFKSLSDTASLSLLQPTEKVKQKAKAPRPQKCQGGSCWAK